jgi:hypothetical protein
MTMTTKMQRNGKAGLVTAAAATLAFALFAAPSTEVVAQQAPGQLTVALYAPSASFRDSAARSAYVQGLAKAIQNKTGVPTSGKAYVRYSDLKSARPDFAIIEGQCLAVGAPGPVLATAQIGSSTSQSWALFSRGDNFMGLRGKKLAFMDTGCRDSDFLDNAMLDSEAKVKSHFSTMVGKPDSYGAVQTVLSYKQADAVFAPSSQGTGLTKIFDTGQVPNPGFVQMNKNVSAGVASNVQSAVLSYGADQAITGWKAAASYAASPARWARASRSPSSPSPCPCASTIRTSWSSRRASSSRPPSGSTSGSQPTGGPSYPGRRDPANGVNHAIVGAPPTSAGGGSRRGAWRWRTNSRPSLWRSRGASRSGLASRPWNSSVRSTRTPISPSCAAGSRARWCSTWPRSDASIPVACASG